MNTGVENHSVYPVGEVRYVNTTAGKVNVENVKNAKFATTTA